MKPITTTIAFIALMFSVNTMAYNAIETVNIKTIKHTLTPEQIQLSLNQWKASELANLESIAQSMSDKVPLEARRELAKERIEMEYKQSATALGL